MRHDGVVSTPTQTLPDVDTRPEGTDTTGDDSPKMFHYVRKNKIESRTLRGTVISVKDGKIRSVCERLRPAIGLAPQVTQRKAFPTCVGNGFP